MPPVPSTSPATGQPTPSAFVHTTAGHFVDSAGRTLLLRGVNLSGSSKAPVGQPSYILDDFWESADAGGHSFVGRPLRLDDGSADVHLARLRGWGFNMLRFPVTWEALEHDGPGMYDDDFIDYTVRVLQKCKEYGFKVYMDPHQDIWSRFSGGSGAPFWTLAACGIDPRNFTATQAAILHCEYPLVQDPDPATLPAMVWSTNYGRLLAQTIFTLFFAGADFAPNCIINNTNIQHFLQHHYIEAFGRLADRIAAVPGLADDCVIGWDSMNEPFEGLCGWDDLSLNPTAQGSTLKKGTYPTPAQSLRLGMGQPQTVDSWSFGTFGPSRNGSVTIDPKGRTIWADPASELPDGTHPRWRWQRDPARWPLGSCLWAQHGVWDIASGFVLRPDYFRCLPGTDERVDFVRDYWRPHFLAFAARIRAAQPEAILFVQPPVFARPPRELGEAAAEAVLGGRCAYSGHYYDGLTLVTRHWNWFNADALGLLRGRYSSTLQAVKIGEAAIRRSLQEQLGMLKDDATILGAYPTIIGEIGTPFDMDGKRSYGWTDGGRYKGDYGRQEKALDASLNGADGANAVNWTVWTYCPDHSHDWGDGWNMEDLSLWSPDDMRPSPRHEGPHSSSSRDDVGEMYGAVGGESRAVLLRKNKVQPPSLMASAAASSLSLATLGSMHAGSGGSPPGVGVGVGPSMSTLDGMSVDGVLLQQQKTRSRGRGLAGWRMNPYDFLTDGARAVRAFSRPWPQKTVGMPSDIKFDLGRAQFRLVVTVGPEDRVRVREPEGEGEDAGALATEIYVPLVHYAREKWVRRAAGGSEPETEHGPQFSAEEDGMRRSGSVDDQKGRGSRVGSANASTIDLETMPPATGVRHRMFESSSSSTGSGSSVSSTATASPEFGARTEPDGDLVDLDVMVSAGRWEVEGQVLRWWYDVPAEGEGKREYTIEIRRRGGVIKLSDFEEEMSLCEQLCPAEDRCCIM